MKLHVECLSTFVFVASLSFALVAHGLQLNVEIEMNRRVSEPTNETRVADIIQSDFQLGLAQPLSALKCGQENRSVSFGGREREYVVYTPCSNGTINARAILLTLHCFDECTMWSLYNPFKALAEKFRFVLLAPNGLERSWNAEICCGHAKSQEVDDAGFLHTLVNAVNVGHDLPILATGASNGGFMASLLALKYPGWFRGLAVVAGHQYNGLEALIATPILVIWGKQDHSVFFDGCCSSASQQCCCNISPNGPDQCVSTQMIFKSWMHTNSCDGVTSLPGVVYDAKFDGGLTCTAGNSCSHSTQLCTGELAGHMGYYGTNVSSKIASFFDENL